MIFEVQSIDGGHKGKIKIGNRFYDCALGKAGTIPSDKKREGDHKSPIGNWKFRRIFYRKDKIPYLEQVLPDLPYKLEPLEENFGWCDDKNDENYNKFVLHPYPKSAEKLWRKDDVYNIIVVLGYNDDPVVKDHGSAIFLHCARPDYSGTEGCVAVHQDDLITLLQSADEDSSIDIIS